MLHVLEHNMSFIFIIKYVIMKYICEGFNCMDLTILMPCLNEEKTIEICIEKALDFLSCNDIDGGGSYC